MTDFAAAIRAAVDKAWEPTPVLPYIFVVHPDFYPLEQE